MPLGKPVPGFYCQGCKHRVEVYIMAFLHGGPGGTSLPAVRSWEPWEDHFTVAHWDQRGASRTFSQKWSRRVRAADD